VEQKHSGFEFDRQPGLLFPNISLQHLFLNLLAQIVRHCQLSGSVACVLIAVEQRGFEFWRKLLKEFLMHREILRLRNVRNSTPEKFYA